MSQKNQKKQNQLNNGKARMSIRDFSESLTSKESHGTCVLLYMN